MEPETLWIAKKLCSELKRLDPEMNIILYHSRSYDSVYLKFDFGLANSMRIADHINEAKKRYSYRYNIVLDHKTRSQDLTQEYPKYFFPPEDYKFVAQEIVNNSQEKLERYGEEKYLYYMERNRDDLPDNDWQSYIITENGEEMLVPFNGGM